MDTSTVAVTVSSGLVIALIVQFLKSWLEQGLLKSTNTMHDSAIQVMAGVIGVVGFVAHAASLTKLNGPIFWDNAGQGFLAGISAVATYHILSAATVATKETAPTINVLHASPNLPPVDLPSTPPAV